MAAFRTIPIVITGTDMPHIVQRFLLTSERYLFDSLVLRCIQPGTHAREST
jgi:hypothetical protein